jgi:AmmeMemoRadiSam system protein B/AmmeMemoRadiSam system protein A
MDKQLNKSGRRKRLLHLPALCVCVFSLLLVSVCKKETPAPSNAAATVSPEKPAEPAKVVLHSSLAGTWYSNDPEALKKQFDDFFEKAQPDKIENVIALILPHAGYQWSGQTAAFGLKTISKKYKRIVVIGPSHRTAMEEIISVPRATHFETPLGQIPLDTEFIDKLLRFPMVQNVPQAHQSENSIEMELPILQYCQKNFKLVPIVAGQCSLEAAEKAGAILRSLVDEDTLVVASSDFVHYGRAHLYVPFTENIPEQIKELDMGAYKYIANLDAKGFFEYKRKTGATICGSVPIAILLSMMSEPSKAHLIKYTISGGLTGDFSNSVSYMSIAFSGEWQKPTEIEPQSNNAELTEDDKKQLLLLARKTMVYALQNRQVPEAVDLGITISDAMQPVRAAFVTLKKNGVLRGCIGDIFPRQPLYKSVIINAINACVNDRRFVPVSQDELEDITIEISALTVPAPIASPDEIRIGIDGVVLNKDGYSAVFLPQVAPEQGWNVDEMLTQLSLKARLPSDAWKQGASFLVFQAEVFGENEK